MFDKITIGALMDAIQGECNGLAVTKEQAAAILEYVVTFGSLAAFFGDFRYGSEASGEDERFFITDANGQAIDTNEAKVAFVVHAANKHLDMRAALEQAEAFLERQIACATGGSDITDVDYAENFNGVLEQINDALHRSASDRIEYVE